MFIYTLVKVAAPTEQAPKPSRAERWRKTFRKEFCKVIQKEFAALVCCPCRVVQPEFCKVVPHRRLGSRAASAWPLRRAIISLIFVFVIYCMCSCLHSVKTFFYILYVFVCVYQYMFIYTLAKVAAYTEQAPKPSRAEI